MFTFQTVMMGITNHYLFHGMKLLYHHLLYVGAAWWMECWTGTQEILVQTPAQSWNLTGEGDIGKPLLEHLTYLRNHVRFGRNGLIVCDLFYQQTGREGIVHYGSQNIFSTIFHCTCQFVLPSLGHVSVRRVRLYFLHVVM